MQDSWDDVDLSSVASSTCPNWRDMAAKSPLNKARFSDCTSGLIRKDYGVGYDYKSIMHYQKNL